jgi:cell division protein FtsW
VKQQVRSDRALIWTALILVLIGMLTVYTAGAWFAQRNLGGSHELLKRNAFRVVLGLVALFAAYSIDYRVYQRHARKAILLAIGLLTATLFFGTMYRGTRGALMGIQPGEMAKLALVVYLADVLSRRRQELADFVHGLLPRLILVGLVVGLILLQPDFGSALAVVVLSMVMLFLGGAKLLHLAGLGAAAAVVGAFAVRHVGYISERVGVWRSVRDLSLEGVDTQGAAYQIHQSLIALGSGGVTGRGIGGSLQRAFVPDSYTDFAFSIWSEELGFIGAMALVGVFVFLMLRGLRIARRAPDLYSSLLASGLTAMIIVYATINIGVATALIPTTGLPLPFVSYGGSSLVVNMAAVGILINMTKRRDMRGAAPEAMARRWRETGPGPAGRRSASTSARKGT